jgi:hypothetical protein
VQPRIRLAIFVIIGAMGLQGHAAPANIKSTNKSKMKINDVTDKKNKVEGDIDKEITNARLRAESGSKSKWSLSTSMNYSGGSVSRPFGEERPNLSGVPENQVDTGILGTMRTRYRWSKNDSIAAGISMGVKTPFQGDVNSNENQLNFGDPFLAYNRTWAMLGLQNSWSITGSVGTSDESQNIDQMSSLATDYNLMKAFQNGFSVGFTASGWYNFYESAPGDNEKTALPEGSDKIDRRTEYQINLLPTAEYKFNDMFSFRTMFGYFRWRHLYGDYQGARMLRVKEYQSVGLGVAVTRDVYLYPNVQFLPREIRSDYTNFGLSATLNVF